MTKRQVNIVLGVLATLVIVCVLLVAAGAWFGMSVLHRQEANERTAIAAFDAARARFKGATPVFEFRTAGPVLTRPVPAPGPHVKLRTMHVLHWQPDERSLTQLDLPFALLRLKDGPLDIIRFINVASGSYPMQGVVSIRISEIEQFGPTLLIDQQLEDDHRVLVWTE